MEATKLYRLGDLAGRGLRTSEDVSDAIDTVFDSIVNETISPTRANNLLEAIGKRISLESLKLRAGVTPTLKQPGFYQSIRQLSEQLAEQSK